MSNLTITAYWSRKFIKLGGAIVIGIIALQIGITSLVSYIRSRKQDKPDYRLGIITPVVFPQKTFDKKTFTYTLPNDQLPKVPKLLPIYTVSRPVNTLLAKSMADDDAKAMGFSNEGTEQAPGVYQYKNDVLSQVLTLNVLDGSFVMNYPYLTDQLLTTPEKIPTKETAISQASQFLQKGGKLTDDLKGGKKEVTFFRITADKLEPLPASNGANIARVDFFRKPILFKEQNYAILPQDPKVASAYALVSGSSVTGRQIVEVSYKFSPIDRQVFGTYPIKPVAQAQDEFNKGDYWPARDISNKTVDIRNIYLAYFEPGVLDKTMQPIYVFEDEKKNFVGYVSALGDQTSAN